MTPIGFTIKDGVTYFHYKFSELKNFVRLGKKHGDLGVIITKRNGKMLTYRGFGTIESPNTSIITFSINQSGFFGCTITDEERLIPPKPFFTKENTKFI